ncbi:MAG: amino acid permease [Coriobacteriia bacterium]|nr:amino acid permease [Coriobacteriia bacterium]
MDRYLKPIDVWAIAFGCVIGWGAFVMPGTTFLNMAGADGTVLGFAISTAVILVIGKNYSFLMAHRAGTGGVYAYTKEAFGRDHAFLCSWFLTLSYITIVFLNATAVFLISRTFCGDLLQVGLHYQIAGYDVYMGEVALTAAILVATSMLFILDKPLLQKIQTVLALILIGGIVIIAVTTLPHLQWESVFEAPVHSNIGQIPAILTIVVLAPWAFVGFDIASLETAHFKFPLGKSWKTIAAAILAGGLAYIALSLISISYVPDGFASWQDYLAQLNSLAGTTAVPTFYAAEQAMGPAGTYIVAITALAAILTGIVGASRGTIRMLSTMAEDRILSKEFLGTTFCIVFIMVFSIAISLLGRNALEWFIELTSFGATVAFGYASAATYKIAGVEGSRSARVTGVIGFAFSAVFMLVQLISNIGQVETMGAPSFLLLAIWCLLGFIFYWRTMRQSNLKDFNGVSTSSTVLYCLLFYSALMWFLKSLMEAEPVTSMDQLLQQNGVILMAFVLVGLAVMLYVQTMLRKRHSELRADMVRAEESSKAKSQFLFNMSHDIRTPLNAIIGYTYLIEREENVPGKVQDYVGKIDAAGKNLLSLINDILEMSRIESGRMELEPTRVDLRVLLDDTKSMFQTQMAEKGIDFRVNDSQVTDPFVWCDGVRLNRVLNNLLSNAYKFTPEGGTVTMSLWQSGAEDEGRGHYELRVKDTGIGMSPEFAARVFDAFERERTSTVSGIQGTGLGMAITKRIVDQMGGAIEVATAPGLGTEFIVRLTLDLAPEDPAGSEEHALESASADISGLKVLVVEDNDINREILLMLLEGYGIQADSANDGREAVDAMIAGGPGRYDAVLMDVQMPVMDGYEATRAIRALEDARIAQVPIFAVTANAFGEDVRKAEEAGMSGHIAKPIDPDELTSALATLIR